MGVVDSAPAAVATAAGTFISTDAGQAVTAATAPFWDPFPIPFRILFLICFGIWCWGSNVAVLEWLHIDAAILLGVAGEKGLRHRKIYHLAAGFSLVLAVGWCAFLATRSDTAITIVFAAFFLLTVNPMDGWCRRERFRFLKSLGRIVFGGLGSAVYLSDVLLADILTSFAKIFADMYATLCHIILLGGLDLAAPGLVTGSACAYHWIGPALTAMPYALRLKQCLIEAAQSSHLEERRRHFANAAKYATAFPVIFLSAIQQLRHRKLPNDSQDILAEIVTDDMLPAVWFACVMLNSLYSFYWDVAMDWQLGLFKPFMSGDRDSQQRAGYRELSSSAAASLLSSVDTALPSSFSSQPPIAMVHTKYLRPMLHFGEPLVYYLAIALDFLLRFTWSLKLSTHLRLDELTAGGFVLEWLEVVRRWVWVYFRLEREWVLRGHAE